MKKLILVCCFVLCATAISFAQGGAGGSSRGMNTPNEQAKRLQIRLNLNSDQTAKAFVIYAAQAAKRDSIMKAAAGDRDVMMNAMRPMQAATIAKITALLNDEQKATWKKMQDEQAARRLEAGGMGVGTPPAK